MEGAEGRRGDAHGCACDEGNMIQAMARLKNPAQKNATAGNRTATNRIGAPCSNQLTYGRETPQTESLYTYIFGSISYSVLHSSQSNF